MDIYLFQSTLPRRERPGVAAVKTAADFISIHAPAKGATFRKWPHSRHFRNFNPRSREGSDDKIERVRQTILISIHAPAKGATAILYNKFHFLCIILYILSAIT